jgi:hypothetical protein
MHREINLGIDFLNAIRDGFSGKLVGRDRRTRRQEHEQE